MNFVDPMLRSLTARELNRTRTAVNRPFLDAEMVGNIETERIDPVRAVNSSVL
jgi:hypothetical protein